ncbi:MAG: sugar phosphate isomerase/epimerase [Elusimicrobiota bacterium]
MKLGFLTACMGDNGMEDILKFASGAEFNALEVACWPLKTDRDFFGRNIDVVKLDKDGAKKINELFVKYGMTISSLGFYDNNLHPDLKKRADVYNHFVKVVDAAALLGCGMAGTFIGRNPEKTEKENFEEFTKIFTELLKYAGDKGVKVMIENCPMYGWLKEYVPGTISFCPEQWEEMFNLVPAANFGLNYDPSHLYGMGMDYIKPIYKFKDRIFHVHAKDCELLRDNIAVRGYHRKGLYRFRAPGYGEINWEKFMGVLYEIGYDGTVSIEHEDPVFRGSDEKIKKGLILGARKLLPLII